MRVLVTGGAGFIGVRLVKKLLNAGHEPVVLSRRPILNDPELARQVEVLTADLRDFSDTIRSVHLSKASRIVHVAYALTAEGEANPHWAAQVNVLGTNNLYEAARLSGVGRIIFCSSIAAYGTPDMYGDRPVNEEEVLLRSSSIYGVTKALNEFMAAKFEAKYGVEIPSVRISAVYGSGREARGVTAWTSQMVAAAVACEKVKIAIRPDQKANFIYVEDAAEQLMRLVLKDNLQYRVYNSGGFTATPAHFAQIVKKYIPEADIQFDESAPLWPYPHLVDGRRLEQEIGFKVRQPEDCLLEQLNRERSGRGMPLLYRGQQVEERLWVENSPGAAS